MIRSYHLAQVAASRLVLHAKLCRLDLPFSRLARVITSSLFVRTLAVTFSGRVGTIHYICHPALFSSVYIIYDIS
jgi:hypothetical protein